MREKTRKKERNQNETEADTHTHTHRGRPLRERRMPVWRNWVPRVHFLLPLSPLSLSLFFLSHQFSVSSFSQHEHYQQQHRGHPHTKRTAAAAVVHCTIKQQQHCTSTVRRLLVFYWYYYYRCCSTASPLPSPFPPTKSANCGRQGWAPSKRANEANIDGYDSFLSSLPLFHTKWPRNQPASSVCSAL